MNNGPKEAKDFLRELKKIKEGSNIDVDWAIAPTFLTIPFLLNKNLDGGEIPLASQNFFYEDNGAYTGEVSISMLKEINIDYVIIGHSERREYFNETNKIVNLKIKKALKENVTPILAFGETLEQFENNETFNVIKNQLTEGLANIENEIGIENIIIAYEPIWAIGTGKTATPDQAQSSCKYARKVLSEIFDEEISNKIRIQYGGSVNENNIKELMSMDDIDGALVGGASLNPQSFFKLITFDKW